MEKMDPNEIWFSLFMWGVIIGCTLFAGVAFGALIRWLCDKAEKEDALPEECGWCGSHTKGCPGDHDK